MKHRTIRRSASMALLAAALALGGCASTATPQAMVPAAPVKVAKQHPYSVAVATSGGTDSVATGTSISDPEFKTAIENSIKQSKVFKEVLSKDGQYLLSAQVITLDKPIFGASFTVKLEAGWTLQRTSDKQLVYRKAIKSEHTATMSDSLVGMTRMQLAVEGAARKNIEQALVEIGNVTLAGSVGSAR